MRPAKSLPRVFLCVRPVDFRKSIDGLSLIVQEQLILDPFEATLYCFVNRRGDKIKILGWERNGFCLWYKRLEKQRFHWPASIDDEVITLDGQQLNWLLDGIDLWNNEPHRELRFAAVG